MKFSQTLSDAAVLQELGTRLAQLRLNRNLTQQALADEAGVALRTLTRIECGEPSQTANMIRVLRVLGLLGNLEALVPEAPASPMQQLKLKGKVRRRASSTAPARVAEPWSWNLPDAAAPAGIPDQEPGRDS